MGAELRGDMSTVQERNANVGLMQVKEFLTTRASDCANVIPVVLFLLGG